MVPALPQLPWLDGSLLTVGSLDLLGCTCKVYCKSRLPACPVFPVASLMCTHAAGV
jgi:hypothetical protein